MAPSPFLTSFIRHRDPKLLWPVAGVASVVAHGVALVLVRTLVIQTPALPEGAMAPLPIQLLTLPTDLPAPAEPSASSPDLASSDSASVEPAAAAPPTPVAAQATPISPANSPANTETLRPPLEPFITSAPPQAVAPSVAPAPP
ncbi:MAG: hypothetical protein WBG32_19970, partial [Nodosilinea sp.]